jgi:hypothetical protein
MQISPKKVTKDEFTIKGKPLRELLETAKEFVRENVADDDAKAQQLLCDIKELLLRLDPNRIRPRK